MSQFARQLCTMSLDDWFTRGLFLGRYSLRLCRWSSFIVYSVDVSYPGVSHFPAFASVPHPALQVRFFLFGFVKGW